MWRCTDRMRWSWHSYRTRQHDTWRDSSTTQDASKDQVHAQQAKPWHNSKSMVPFSAHHIPVTLYRGMGRDLSHVFTDRVTDSSIIQAEPRSVLTAGQDFPHATPDPPRLTLMLSLLAIPLLHGALVPGLVQWPPHFDAAPSQLLAWPPRLLLLG